MSSLDNIINGYRPISLKEMDAVALMNRTDTKFVVSKSVALSVLETLCNSYQVLEIDTSRMFQYRTVYFDTADKQLLYEHLRGKLNRVKVRSREYVGTSTRFFEVKLKTNKGKTVKSRIPKTADSDIIKKEEAVFLSSVSTLEAKTLGPVIEIDFMRTTLVSLEYNERITFDFQLSFSSEGKKKVVDEMVIVELKRDSNSTSGTPITKALKSLAAYPSSMSKYCLGMILLDETNQYNNYKPKLLKLNKLSTNGNIW